MNSTGGLATYAKLKRIKVFREQRAAAALTAQRAVVEQRTRDLDSKRHDLAEFQDQRPAREQALFDALAGRSVQPRDIDAMNLRISALREREAAMQTDVMAAEQALEEARQAMDQARAVHSEAEREVEKIDEMIRLVRQGEEREGARREENEIEEIVTAEYARPQGRGQA